MKKIFFMKFFLFFCFLDFILIAQPWSYDFGTSTESYTTNNSASTTFLPTPPSGGGTSRVRVSNGGGGGFHLSNPGLSGFGSDSELRIVAPTGTSVNKFSIYDYTAGKSFALRFSVRFGASDGSSSGASSGTWSLFVGDGSTYSDNNTFSGTQVFSGLRWVFSSGGSITFTYRSGSSWINTGITGTPFSQGTNYVVDIYGNNTTGTLTYNYVTSQSVASNRFDLWVNGSLIGDDLSKAQLSDDSNIDSWMFYGESSTGNVANIFLDDIYYTNYFPTDPLPVELTSFSASLDNNKITLNWETQTEINNYGFEIERASSLERTNGSSQSLVWERIGFVPGNGNSNAPKKYSFIDNTLTKSGKYAYRLKQIDSDGTFEYSKEVEVDFVMLDKFSLDQNYPNPFGKAIHSDNPSTIISWQSPISSWQTLKVYDVLGTEVANLVDEFREAGSHKIEFKLGQMNLPTGVYFYQLKVGNFVETKKMVLIR